MEDKKLNKNRFDGIMKQLFQDNITPDLDKKGKDAIKMSILEGFLTGYEEGFKTGWERGRSLGFEEGKMYEVHFSLLDIACKLKAAGVSSDIILAVTGIHGEEI